MKNKTYRFAAVAAVLLALCLVFMAPVSAEEGISVSDFNGLKAALTAQEQIINIAAPITVTEQLNINYSVTINGNNYLLTADNSVRKLFTINDKDKGTVSSEKITVVFNQVNLTSNYQSRYYYEGRLIDTRGGNFDLTVTNSKLDVYDGTESTVYWQPINIGGYETTKVNVTIQDTEIRTYHGYGIMIWNPVDLKITDSTAVTGYSALYFKNNTDPEGNPYGAKGSTVSIVNSKLSSYANWPNSQFGTVTFEDDDITVTVDKDSEIEAYAVKSTNTDVPDAYQHAFFFSYNTKQWETGYVYDNLVVVNGKVTLLGDGVTSISHDLNPGTDTYNTVTFENGAKANAEEVSKYIDEEKLFLGEPDEDYYYEVVGKTWEITISPNSHDFVSLEEGYETQPETVKVTIQNTGNQPLQIKSVNSRTSAFYYSDIVGTVIPEGSNSVCLFNINVNLGLKAGTYEDTVTITTNSTATGTISLKFVVTEKAVVPAPEDPPKNPTSKPTSKPTTPTEPETPVVPETPEAGEVTVETEVTDGGEVELETPAAGGSAAAEEETKITGVVLPAGTDSEVAFIPVSEQPAPAGKETQTKKVFEINVPTYEKGKAATIKFTMTVAELTADGKTAADVALWHFDEETGEWTKLVTSYTIVDGVVYFEAITYDFSPFAIIYEDEQPEQPTEEPETPASPAPLFAVLAALGAAVVLRRK